MGGAVRQWTSCPELLECRGEGGGQTCKGPGDGFHLTEDLPTGWDLFVFSSHFLSLCWTLGWTFFDL